MIKHRFCKPAFSISMWLAISLAITFISNELHAENLSITVYAGDYYISDEKNGQKIVMEDFGYLLDPGKPMLPARNFLIALPPGAQVNSVEIEGLNSHKVPGYFQILPSPPILPLVDSDLYSQYLEKIQADWQDIKESIYSSDEAYPDIRGKLKNSGTLRKYSYVSVSFYPFSYHPLSGKLVYYDAALVSVDYVIPSAGSLNNRQIDELKRDTIADERAQKLFINYNQIKSFYQPPGLLPSNHLQIYDYIIITAAELQNTIAYSEFIGWKSDLGYNVRIIPVNDPDIINQPGIDLTEKIRNFLRSRLVSWSMEYVLLIGDYATIPMRYCYPNPENHANGAGDPSAWPWSGDVPTDYYYADLSYPDSVSWDLDGDGYYGEYGQDNPDFLAEVYVGRIPTNDTSRISYTLDKLLAFEQDTGSWKSRAIHAGAIAYFANEDYSGRELRDGAIVIDEFETDFMSDWTISHYSEQSGLAPSEHQWSSISEAAFTGDWRTGQYSVVNWYAHGWSDRVARKVWQWDDGDNVPESNEMWWPDLISINSNLDDDYPSIVFALSCMVGYPEPNAWGNLGIDLLTEPAFGASAGIVSSTRVGWVSVGGGEEHMYEFNHFLINGPYGPERVGNALYDSEFYCSQIYSWDHYAEYWNLFSFNLYGDPALEINYSQALCEYLPGDANMTTGQWPPQVIGSDVTYLVNFFRGSQSACNINDYYCAGDANGDCQVIGSDVTRLVGYFRGIGEISYCPGYTPSWLTIDDCPAYAPSGWPNCE